MSKHDARTGVAINGPEVAASFVAWLLSILLILRLVGPQLARWRSTVDDGRPERPPAMERVLLEVFAAVAAIVVGFLLVVIQLAGSPER